MGRRQERGGWQALIQYVGAQMHRPVEDDRLQRALDTAAGNLTQSPPWVVSTQTLEFYRECVLASAFSPSGKLALVVARENFTCGLVTWTHERGWREHNRSAESWSYDSYCKIEVSFPHGSDEPLVVITQSNREHQTICTDIRWGEIYLQVSEIIFQIFGLHDDSGWQIYISSPGGWVSHTSRCGTLMNEPYRYDENVSWVGIVEGKIAKIQVGNGRETLHWHRGQIAMPNGGEESIEPETFVSTNGWLLFISYDSSSNMAVWRTNGISTSRFGPFRFRDRDSMTGYSGTVPWRILKVEGGGQLHLMGDDGFKPFGPVHPSLWGPPPYQVVCLNDEIAVVYYESAPPTLTVLTASGHKQPLNSQGIQWVEAMHGMLVLDYNDGRLTCLDPNSLAQPSTPKRTSWPLYGTPYRQATPVQDGRGKAIMTWGFTDGTVHVLRYPIPF
jgi:hypothetical protein